MSEKHRNADGTYDGIGVMSEVTGLARGEISEIWAIIQANGAKLSACPWHDFNVMAKSETGLKTMYRCQHCGGEIDGVAHKWHELGRRPKP